MQTPNPGEKEGNSIQFNTVAAKVVATSRSPALQRATTKVKGYCSQTVKEATND